MENTDQLKDIHPSFHVQATKIYVNEIVQKVNTHGSLQERVLIVTNSGIFLLQQRTFPRSYYVSRIIPHSQLVLIIVDETTMQFYCGGVTMKLKHPKHAEIAAIVYLLRVGLFGEKPRPVKIEISPKVQHIFDDSNFVFESDSILGDRFLSLALTIPAKKYQADNIAEIREQLCRSQSTFIISAELAASSYANAFANALALHQNLQQVEFADLSICSVASILHHILDTSTSIQSVVFRNVSFVGEIQLSPTTRRTTPQQLELSFYQCDTSTGTFNQFFEKILKYSFDFISLIFESCTFSISTFDNIMRIIMSHPSLENLCRIHFSKLSQFSGYVHTSILKLYGSKFMSKSKTLKSIAFTSCGLNLNQLIGGIFKSPTTIEELNFAGNKILMAAEIESITNLHNLCSIDFSDCQFTGSSLLSLFVTLSKPVASRLSSICLDELQMDENGWDLFYNKIKNYHTTLRRISFAKNKMNLAQATSFSDWLTHQVNLREFSFSTIEFDDDIIKQFAESFKSLTLERLDIINPEGTQDTHSIIPIIKALPSLKVLHLENPDGGETLLSQVEEVAQGGKLVDLVCDGSNVQSLNSVYSYCQTLMSSRLSSANWPEKDIKNIIMKLPLKERSANKQKMDTLKHEFVKRMGSKKKSVALPSSPVTDKRNVDAILSKRDAKIEILIKECVENASGTVDEPLLVALADINKITSVDFLYTD